MALGTVISDGSPDLIPAIQVYRSQGLASRPHPRLEAGDPGNRPVSWMPFKSDSWSVCERVDEPPEVQRSTSQCPRLAGFQRPLA